MMYSYRAEAERRMNQMINMQLKVLLLFGC